MKNKVKVKRFGFARAIDFAIIYQYGQKKKETKKEVMAQADLCS